MTTSEKHYQCLAVRRVNPFLGALQVVITRQARAISSDGQHWEIQVYAERPTDLWGGQGSPAADGLFRFGAWSPHAGLERVPLNPILNNAAILPAAGELVDTLERVHAQVPFPQTDRLELWLLGRDHQPLALLCTAVSEPERARRGTPGGWLAGVENLPIALAAHARGLEIRIAQAAGDPPSHCWFLREQDGGGLPLPPCTSLARVPSAAFPEALFRDPEPPDDTDPYMGWLAPRLLTLTALSDATRSRLERLARPHALELAARWRLYPKIIHPKSMNSARVEATIRQSAGHSSSNRLDPSQ